ncbi:MAG: hypothetical protein ACLUD0_06315 [Eubacterium ramulus]
MKNLVLHRPDRLLKQFDEMSNQMNHTNPREINEIKERLKEDSDRGGAYYCSLPSFRDSYRLVSRMLERNGQSAYLMLCSITDGKGHPMEKPEKLAVMAEELQNSIQHSLRRGDSFTKYSSSQYLILLTGTNKENCEMIFDRLRKYFHGSIKAGEKIWNILCPLLQMWKIRILRFSFKRIKMYGNG